MSIIQSNYLWDIIEYPSVHINVSSFYSKTPMIIGASVSEPHTSELNCDFSYIYYLAYVVPYILGVVI